VGCWRFPILLCDGSTQYIERIQVGDWVWSRDADTGEFGCREVVALMVTPDQMVLSVEVLLSDGSSEIFGVTAEHPFHIVGEGWKPAGELRPGDEIFTSSGGWMRVTGSTWQAHTQTVYNFEVADFHTYFVGDGGAWVHNAGCSGGGPVGRGSTANPAKGTTKPRNLSEQLAIEEAMGNPKIGTSLGDRLPLNDPRWPHSEGWVKMQHIHGNGKGRINVHYNYNTINGLIDDFKIKLEF